MLSVAAARFPRAHRETAPDCLSTGLGPNWMVSLTGRLSLVLWDTESKAEQAHQKVGSVVSSDGRALKCKGEINIYCTS